MDYNDLLIYVLNLGDLSTKIFILIGAIILLNFFQKVFFNSEIFFFTKNNQVDNKINILKTSVMDRLKDILNMPNKKSDEKHKSSLELWEEINELEKILKQLERKAGFLERKAKELEAIAEKLSGKKRKKY